VIRHLINYTSLFILYSIETKSVYECRVIPASFDIIIIIIIIMLSLQSLSYFLYFYQEKLPGEMQKGGNEDLFT